MFLEDLTGLVLWALFTVIVINVVFLIFVFFRRVRRKRYYKDKDGARIRFQPVVAELAANYITVEEAAEFLREAHSKVERDAVQELLFSAMTAENEGRVSKLFFMLGYVERWSKKAYGRGRAAKVIDAALQHEQPTTLAAEKSPLDGYRRLRVSSVPRAVAIYNLGRLAPEYSTLFAAEALRDPATDVRRSAIAALGRNRNVAAIPLLVEELRKSIEEHSDVSIRSTKAALAFYSLAELRQFVPYLTHPNRRLRFFIVDIVRDITNKAARNTTLSKNDFAPQLYEIYLQKVVNDDFGDVRARSVAVIRHFHDQRAAQALRALLSDENEFVRLHAVRAAADPHYIDLIPQIVPLMADRKWRVREAAVRTLGSFGSAGTSQVYRYFLQSKDNYASEQIADEIQRVGFMTHVTDFHVGGGEDASLVQNVFHKMAGMKKTSLMNNMVASGSAPELRMMLMDALATAPTAELPGVLEAIAKSDTGEVGVRAGALLRKIQTPGGNA